MTFPKPLVLAAALALTVSAAQAGSPDNPGERGRIIDQQKTLQQANAGAANGWGQTVQDRATNGSSSGARNLGDFLKMQAGGPNPLSDNGKGNDNR